MDLVASMGDAAFFPRERELHQFPVGDGDPADVFEPARICVPTTELGRHRPRTVDGEPPIGYRSLEHGVVGQHRAGRHPPSLDALQELIY
jgi:hypothetical protein